MAFVKAISSLITKELIEEANKHNPPKIDWIKNLINQNANSRDT